MSLADRLLETNEEIQELIALMGLERVETALREAHYHHKHHRTNCGVGLYVRADEGSITLMAGTATASTGATGNLVLVALPVADPANNLAAAKFTGTPKIVSSDDSVAVVTDNGDGTASVSFPGANGATCTLTGSDDAFSDTIGITIADAPVAQDQVGVGLSLQLN